MFGRVVGGKWRLVFVWRTILAKGTVRQIVAISLPFSIVHRTVFRVWMLHFFCILLVALAVGVAMTAFEV